jgi:hypothetical protein
VSMRACAFFPPSLDPVLDGGKGDTDAVGAPEVPTRGPVGQAVFDHQPYRQIKHAVGVLSAGGRQSREVRVKVLATLRTVKFIPIMVYCASHERRHHRWPVCGSLMCRLAPQNSWI